MKLKLDTFMNVKRTAVLVSIGIANLVILAILISANLLGLFESVLELTSMQWMFVIVGIIGIEFVLMEIFTFLRKFPKEYTSVPYDTLVAIKLESLGKVIAIATPLSLIVMFISAFLKQIVAGFIIIGLIMLALVGVYGFLYINKIMVERNMEVEVVTIKNNKKQKKGRK